MSRWFCCRARRPHRPPASPLLPPALELASRRAVVVVRCLHTQSFNPFATADASSPRDAALVSLSLSLSPPSPPPACTPPTVNCFSTPLRPLACTSTPWWPQIGYSRCECCCRLCLEQQLLLVVLISFCVHVRLRVKSLLVPSALIAVSPAPLPVWFSYPCVCIQCSIR